MKNGQFEGKKSLECDENVGMDGDSGRLWIIAGVHQRVRRRAGSGVSKSIAKHTGRGPNRINIY